MKKFLRIIGMAICSYVIFCFTISCTQEGEVGPRGLDGLSGSIIHSGSTAPSASIGTVGDYFFDSSSSDFYGPKTSSGWGNPVNLTGAKGATGERGAIGASGPTGAAGKDGNKLIAVSRAPQLSDGGVGDFFIDLRNSNLYGPKTASSWGTPVNLKGANGANGTKIYNGGTPPSGTLGEVGDFYFQSNGNWYGPKAANGWGVPISLVGPTGASGSNGQDGKTIRNGTSVPETSFGLLGDFYYRTNTGDFYGPKTANGWGNPTNLKGQRGSQIFSGTAIPTTHGDLGDFYFRTNTYDFYGPKTATGWGSPVNLRGATGATGAAGSRIWSDRGNPSPEIGNANDYYINTSTGELFGPKLSTTAVWGSAIMNMRAGEPVNVIYSEWLSRSQGNFQDLSNANDFISFQVPLQVLSKNAEFINKAAINVYAKVTSPNGSNTIVQLNNNISFGLGYPSSMNYQILEQASTTPTSGFSYYLKIEMTGSRMNDDTMKNLSFRYVVIPGNQPSNLFISKSMDSYNQLQNLFNIKD